MEEPLLKNSSRDSSALPNASIDLPVSPNQLSGDGIGPINRSARNSAEPINLDLQPKPSRAIILWMLIIAIVLAILGYEMHGDLRPAYNVVVNMTGDVADCEVVVDGEPQGKFTSRDNDGGESHTVWLKLNDGKHHIDIKKSGAPFRSRDFEVKGKEYLRFDSGNTTDSN